MTQNKKFTKTCSKCGAAKPQDAYSKTQWREAKLTKIKCVECSQKAWTASHDAFTEHCKQQTVTSSADGVPLWQTHTVEEAKCYKVEAPLDALPSECLKKLPGHEGPHWRQAMVGDVSASLRLWVQH